MLPDVEHELRAEVARLSAALGLERRAREHRLQINQLAAVTSGQVTRQGVAEVIAGGASEIFAAGWVIVGYVGDDDLVHLVHGPNVPEPIRADWQRVPLETAVPVCDVLRGTIDRCELSTRDEFSPWPILVDEADRAELSSLVAERVRGDGLPEAVICLGWSREHRMDQAERALLHEFTEAARPAFRRATATEVDRRVASTLQRWLLPADLPTIDGLSLSTIYEPAKGDLDIGGDWYDVVKVVDGRSAIVVGDVVGHDVRAAAEMAQVRHVLSSNLTRSGDAADSLALTDRYFHGRETDTMATALVMVFSADANTLEIASAGHLAPIVVEPGTAARTLDCGLGPPIGTGMGEYTSTVRPFPARTTVVGFTDGVVERPDTPIDQCISDLCREVDHAVSINRVDDMVPALTELIRKRAAGCSQRDDAAAVILQSQRT